MTTPLISTILPTGRVSADKPGSLVRMRWRRDSGGAQTHELYPTRASLHGVLPHFRPHRASNALATARYKLTDRGLTEDPGCAARASERPAAAGCRAGACR